ncbi:MAG: glycosyltransferase family 4 protein [Planctomycetota bacterium]
MVSRAYRSTLRASGHEVRIFARGGEMLGEGDPNWDGEDVTWCPRRRNWPWTSVRWRQFVSWVRDQHLDAVVFNEQNHWPVVARACRELPSVALGTYVDFYTAQTVPYFKQYDFLLCNTQRHYSVFQDHPSCFYLPWGTDTDTFCPAETDESRPFTFFHSAGMSPDRKGTEIVVRAFLQIEDPEARLLVHMQRELSGFPALQQLCESDSRIEVRCETVGAPGLYHLGDVYVYPTVLEGIGLTIAEALACGLPTVTTDCGPMNEFVRHGDNGYLVPPMNYRGRGDGYYWAMSFCDASDVADSMRFYLDRSSQLQEMKDRARCFAVQNLQWAENSKSLADSIESVVQRVKNEARPSFEIEEVFDACKLPIQRDLLRVLCRRYAPSVWRRFRDRICN